jgi:ABC-type sugar transport system substrate-binding protein
MDPKKVMDDGVFSIDVGSGVSRRKLMTQLAAVGTATGLAGCSLGVENGEDSGSGDGDGNAEGSVQAGGADFEFSRHPMVAPPGWDGSKTQSGSGQNQRRAVFVIQNIDNPFFIPMTVGFNDALNIFGWTGGVTGPGQGGGVAEQVNIIETEIENLSAGDVLVTTILDNQAYIDPIQQALDNDIVVVNGHTTPSEADWNYERQQQNLSYRGEPMIAPHVGIRDARGGTAMAAEAYERMQSKLDTDEYTVLLTNELPDNPSVTRRVNADANPTGTAQRYFEAQGNVEIFNDQVINPSPNISEARDTIVSTIGGADVDAVVCSAFWGAVGAGQALAAGELEGPMVICGFDLVEPLLNGIDAGNIDFTVGQDPYSQGFQNVPMAWMYVERGIEMKDLEWGVSVVDQDNVDFALSRRSWGDLLEWQQGNYGFL